MMTRALLLLSSLLMIAGCDASGTTPPPGTDGGTVALMDGGGTPPGTDAGTVPPGTDGGPPPMGTDAGPPTMGTDAGPPAPPGTLAPGSACNCDSECDGTSENAGVCVQGICMMRSSADCASAGSAGECPSGSRCWGLDGVTGGLCWPDCDSFSCDGTCDGDGSCAPNSSSTCTASCSEICTEPPDPGMAPPGPVPTECVIGSSGIQDWRCTSGCGDLVVFDPRDGAGYEDYPLNGETSSDQYRSYIRRDVMMLVRYAAQMVDCQARSWTAGNGGDIGLGDMSEADGSIPGTRESSPGHPPGTHVNGHDMDIGYFQTGTANNRLRSICEHVVDGVDQYHCTEDPIYLDAWRTALFLGHMHASPNLRVIGVDGRAGVAIDAALTRLCTDGWLPSTSAACGGRHSITYEVTDTMRGWYRFHHHHFHISVSAP